MDVRWALIGRFVPAWKLYLYCVSFLTTLLECTGEAELPLNSVLLIDLFLQFSPNLDIQPLKGGNFDNLKNKPGLYMIVVTDTDSKDSLKGSGYT